MTRGGSPTCCNCHIAGGPSKRHPVLPITWQRISHTSVIKCHGVGYSVLGPMSVGYSVLGPMSALPQSSFTLRHTVLCPRFHALQHHNLRSPCYIGYCAPDSMNCSTAVVGHALVRLQGCLEGHGCCQLHVVCSHLCLQRIDVLHHGCTQCILARDFRMEETARCSI